MTKGRSVSHYEIVGQLGAGGMGVVYKARDTKLDRFVALKFLSPHLATSEEAERRFIAEAKAASALDHPNIGVIHEISESEDGLFIAMAFYEGETLQQKLARGPLAPSKAFSIAIQVARGLQKAHERGIVHRDVKPANVLVTEEGVPKILDFGLAKMAHVTSTAPGAAVGTPSYMAPEQVLGESVDARTDVWGLGTLLFEMLSGTVPFRAPSHHGLFNAIVDREPDFPDFPSGVEPILRRCLAKRPDDRYPGMAELVADLERAEAEVSGDSRLETQVQTTIRRPRDVESSERRFLTVVSIQLAEYPRLSQELDPEDLLEVLRAYQDRCREAFRRFSAHVAEQEEGVVLGYFGYPRAREDDSRRAVEAAMAIREALGDRAARIGIHTGSVVVSGSRGGSPIVGPVPGQANRIRDAASPGEIVASVDTHRLVRGWFEAAPLEDRALAGGAQPLELFRVERAVRAPASEGVDHPLVGRRRELELLQDRWQRATEGRGSAVLISGEAGIGKSRLLRALAEGLSGESHRRLEGKCSPQYAETPLHPIVPILEQGLGLEGESPEALGFDRLRRKLSPLGLIAPEEAATVASLLSVPIPESFPRPALTPERRKRVTFEAAVEVLLGSLALLVVEDLHWADATTLELLGILIEQGASSPVMIVMTARGEFVPEWAARARLTQIHLERLSRADVETLVRELAEGKSVAPGMVERVIERTDGVPLFVEELVRSLDVSASAEFIPHTLQELLASRLDALGPAKGVAQIGSVLGRDFSREAILAASGTEEAVLGRELDRLVRAGVLLRKGIGSRAAFSFKHALIQQAAYESLLKSARQELHRRIAELPESGLAMRPEILAHHWAEGDRPEAAIDGWLQAAQRALERSAFAEGQAVLEKAIAQLERLNPGETRDRKELALRMMLGPVLTARRGYGAPEVEGEHLRSVELAKRVGDDMQRFWVPHGIWSVYFVRAELGKAAGFAEETLAHATRLDHPALLYEARYAVGGTAFFCGDLARAREHFEAGLALDSSELDRALVLYAHGLDTGVKTLGLYGSLLWQLGRSDEALARAEASLALAEKLDHPFSRALALYWVAWAHLLRSEVGEARDFTGRLVELSSREASFFSLLAKVIEGWCLAMDGDETGIAVIEESLRIRALGGDRLGRTQYLGLLTEAQIRFGRLEDARRSLAQALSTMRSGGEHLWEAELHRLRGELLSRRGKPGDEGRARSAFAQAVDTARKQGSRALELRARRAAGEKGENDG